MVKNTNTLFYEWELLHTSETLNYKSVYKIQVDTNNM